MGQRLNIEIMKGCTILANAYYHWSAYTSSALELCKSIVEQYKKLQLDPAKTCDSEGFQNELQFAQNSPFREKPKVERVTMEGQYAAADEDILFAVRILESTGAGINREEAKRIRSEGRCPGITFRMAIDRNAGLIAITPTGIDETRAWQEGQVTIDLDRKHIFFGVFWTSGMEDYLEEYEIDPDEEPERVPVKNESGLDIEDFKFEDIDKIIALVEKTKDSGIVNDDGMVYHWIA